MIRFTRLMFSTALVAAAVFGFIEPASAQSVFMAKPMSPTGNYLAGRQALVDLRTADAARFFAQAAVGDWNNPAVIERSFVAYIANGQIGDAATAAQHLIELEPDNELAHLVLATEALKERRYDAAVDDLSKVGDDSFAGITGDILKAWAYVGAGKTQQADDVLDKLGSAGLEDFLVFHRALMAEVTGQTQKSLTYAKQAYDADPYVARIVEAYARMLGDAGKFDDALKVINDFEAQGLTHPLVTAVKDQLEHKKTPGMFASDVQGGASEMFHGIGVALARDNNIETAVVFLRLAMYLEPKEDVIALVYAQMLDAAGQHDEADAIYNKVPADSPMKPTAVLRIASNLDATGERSEAIRRVGNIVTLNPDALDAVSTLGDLLRADGQYVKAADAYTKALQISGGNLPADWRFYYVRGIAYERANEWDKAEPDFLKALQLNPGQPQVLNYLGYSWVDKGIKLDQALDMINKAVAVSPNDGYIVDSLGWAYYQLGRYEDAVKTLEKAVQLSPTDPQINDHLGDAYWRDGRTTEARFQWNIAITVDKEGTLKDQVQPKLANGLDPVAKK